MEIKKDAYRERQVRIMLSHMSGDPDKDYPANLSHWSPDAKPICVESDALNLLADAYAGKYIEVNDPQPSPHTGVNLELEGASFEGCLFWMHYQYEDENYPLFFVRLPGLTNANIVQLLNNFDLMYGSTNQETTDWALEYQLLTRMLVHDKCLLVNPLYLNIATEGIFRDLTKGLSERDLEIYKKARRVSHEAILKAFEEYEV